MKRYIHQSRTINCSFQSDAYYVNIADLFIDEFCSRFGLNKSDFAIDEELDHYTTALDETRINILLKDAGLRLYEIVLQFSRTAKRTTSGQSWKDGIWYINFPEDNVDVSKLVDELDRKSSFHKYLVPRKEETWPSAKMWRSLDTDSEKFEDMRSRWLSEPEDEVNTELNIFTEPSVQGRHGAMFLFDISNGSYDELGSVDFSDWYESELMLASQSKSSDEFKQKYKSYILDTLSNLK